MSTKALELHQSSIGMFLKCGKQFEFRYMRGEVLPPKAALTLGRAVDTAVTHNFTQKIQSEKDLGVSDVLDVYSTAFEKEKPITEWDGEDAGEQKDLGVRMLEVYHKEAAPKIQPVSVQESFRIDTDQGYSLGGTLDLTDKQKTIRDTKTSKSSYSPDAVSDSLQAAMYDFAYEVRHGEKANGFTFDIITKTKQPKYQQVSGLVSEAQRQRLFESINIMHNQIKRGEFNYAPEGAWWCSKSWCGYWSKCKGKK